MQRTDFDDLREQLRCMAVKRIDECGTISKSIGPMPSGLGGTVAREYAKKRNARMAAMAMENSVALGILLALDALNEHLDHLDARVREQVPNGGPGSA
jgi:hypothetical protein